MTVRCKLCGRKVTHDNCVACSRAMRLMGTSDVAMRVATAMMVKEGSGAILEPAASNDGGSGYKE